MDRVRERLDLLMGKDRDVSKEQRISHDVHFDDPRVCPYYFCGFCPYDELRETDAALDGKCNLIHNVDIQIKWQELSLEQKARLRRNYDRELFDVLFGIVERYDKQIMVADKKLEADLGLQPQAKIEYDNLDERVSALKEQLKHIEESDPENDRQIDTVKNIIQDLETHQSALLQGEGPEGDRRMQNCPICAEVILGDEPIEKTEAHLSSKLHNQLEKVRQLCVDLSQKVVELEDFKKTQMRRQRSPPPPRRQPKQLSSSSSHPHSHPHSPQTKLTNDTNNGKTAVIQKEIEDPQQRKRKRRSRGSNESNDGNKESRRGGSGRDGSSRRERDRDTHNSSGSRRGRRESRDSRDSRKRELKRSISDEVKNSNKSDNKTDEDNNNNNNNENVNEDKHSVNNGKNDTSPSSPSSSSSRSNCFYF
eukprot:TRINITY_DN23_c3_g1_i1.p1 TRINITY_DN23_c3_g1~~TRINITY_DN23_c3_g1_i1.p1  ORF type:complete len:421 (-),score=122.72 TRINITY_DN23_c3_g1_i1:947-2209(-)